MHFLLIMCLIAPLLVFAERPDPDKKAYSGKVLAHVNPWFRPSEASVSSTDTYGGPDYAWHKFPNDDGPLMWSKMADLCAKYGIDGIQMEVVNGSGFIDIFEKAVCGFYESGKPVKIIPFISCTEKNPDNLVSMIGKLLEKIKEFRKYKVIAEIDSAPVLAIYGISGFTPENWNSIIRQVEEKHGRCIWLIDAAFIGTPEKLRTFVKVFDGITMYGNWPLEGQKKLFDFVVPIMKKEFPGKICELAVHTNYTSHFHYGGFIPKLSEKFRKSWEITINAAPDNITITNWFDIYENSRIMPSYEMDDLQANISHYYGNKWKGIPEKRLAAPALYILNFTSIRLGEPILFEVLSFPTATNGAVEFNLELCNESGTVLHSFPSSSLRQDTLDSKFFEVSSLDFPAAKAIIPRLKFKWQGRIITWSGLPQTNIVTSIRPHLLYWARSWKNRLPTNMIINFSLNGVIPSSTPLIYSSCPAVFCGTGSSAQGNWIRILRNGREIASFKTLREWGMNISHPMALPSPGNALDWYNMELSDRVSGQRQITPPIWVDSGSRPGKVKFPVWNGNVITETEIEAVRVPFFYYPCSHPAGRILLDESGYDHNGVLGNSEVNAGHLSLTAYRHEHIGNSINVGKSSDIGIKTYPKYQKDYDGGYLVFDGKSYAMLRGGTAFPYAATFELQVKPETDGREESILGAANNQIKMRRLADGRIQVSRSNPVEGEGGLKNKEKLTSSSVDIISNNKVPSGKWTHIAAVFDLKELKLYIDGKLEGAALASPNKSHEWIGSVVLGGDCGFPFIARPGFKGGIRQVRFYGRNLTPSEFLMGTGKHD